MNTLFNAVVIACLGSVFVAIWQYIQVAHKRSRIETALRIGCASGDSETMEFSVNFLDGETEDSKVSKIKEAFQFIQDRKDENHEAWLAMKAKAIAENEAKVAKGENLKLKSITQEK